jgi:hypothetical protein
LKYSLIALIIIAGFGATQTFVSASYAQETVIEATDKKIEKDWLDTLNMRVDLAQARVAALRAKVALEIENSNARANQALDEAEAGYVRARDNDKSKISEEVKKLVDDTIAAKDSVTNAPADTQKKIDELVEHTEEQLKKFDPVALDTDEAKLLKKRYAQLEAEAALLKAKIAEEVDDSGKLATSYLDEAKNWYAKAKNSALDNLHEELVDLSAGIDDAKKAVTHKRGRAADAITALAERAADLVRGEELEKPTE